jgi:hypothetical protein
MPKHGVGPPFYAQLLDQVPDGRDADFRLRRP